MRTPGERTSGAWTGGCAIHPDGGDETDRTAGNSYTATPHNTQGANSGQVLLQTYGEPVTDCRAQPSLESNINSSGSQLLKQRVYDEMFGGISGVFSVELVVLLNSYLNMKWVYCV